MTDASTASAARIFEAILQRPDAMTTLVLLAEGLARELQRSRVLLPWSPWNEGISYARESWWFPNPNSRSRLWTPVEVEQLIKGGRTPWIVTFWLADMPTSPQFATPEEAQTWADEQLVVAGYTLLPIGYNQEATP